MRITTLESILLHLASLVWSLSFDVPLHHRSRFNLFERDRVEASQSRTSNKASIISRSVIIFTWACSMTNRDARQVASTSFGEKHTTFILIMIPESVTKLSFQVGIRYFCLTYKAMIFLPICRVPRARVLKSNRNLYLCKLSASCIL